MDDREKIRTIALCLREHLRWGKLCPDTVAELDAIVECPKGTPSGRREQVPSHADGEV